MLYINGTIMKLLDNWREYRKLNVIFNHTAWWLLLVLYEQATIFATSGRFNSLLPFFVYYSCNAGVFYSQFSLLDKTLNNDKRKYGMLIISFVIGMVFFLFIKVSADLLLLDFSHLPAPKLRIMKAVATLDLLRNFYFAAFGTLYWAISKIGNYQKKADAAEISRLKIANENAGLEVSLAKSENAYLRQQINPHLLFNSLNFIHNSVYKLSHEAAENIILLSDIMRYSLEVTDAEGKITLAKEAEQIENLIKLNLFRFDYSLDISYATEGNLNSYKIIPLVLLTLAENLFKHGDLSGKPAIIHLSVSECGELKFYTSNHKRPIPPVKRIKSIGLENIRIRLNYTYGDNYRLAVNETDEIYKSELTLNL